MAKPDVAHAGYGTIEIGVLTDLSGPYLGVGPKIAVVGEGIVDPHLAMGKRNQNAVVEFAV